MTVTVALIARDEAHRIARCLRSVEWADERVVVVDSRTVDATAEIARSVGARVDVHPFESYAHQRQRAQDLSGSDWVMWMDCDELVTEELACEVRRAVENPAYIAYRVPRLDHMFGRWIRHGGWYPQYHVRLYRREGSRWERDVHEQVVVRGPVGTLRHPVLHDSHDSVQHWVERMDWYTTLEAEAMRKAGRRAGIASMLLEPPLYAAYKYVWQQGWRDGAHGLVLALLLGCYRLLRVLKLWDLDRRARAPEESADCPPPTSPSRS
jgi:glycosyltransferase involved in cell wall biosynthesis